MSQANDAPIRCRTAPVGRALEGDPSDARLIELLLGGDQAAAEALVTRYQSKVHRIAYHLCDGDPDQARDLTQETFVRVFEHLDRFQGQAAFGTWIHRIAVNVCLDHRRRRKRWRALFKPWWGTAPDAGSPEKPPRCHQVADTRPDPLSLVAEEGMTTAVWQALAKLPDRQRLVFYLKVFQDLPIAEIAQVLDLAPGTVKSHLFRATRHLQACLRDWTA